MDLNDIRAALEGRHGKPTATVSLRHKGKGKTKTSAAAPTELDILIFQEDDDGEPFAFLATAGMSLHVMKGPIERAELMMRVDGDFAKKDLEKLARGLGDVAIGPFLEGFGLSSEMILDDIALPLFPGMTSAMVSDEAGEGPEWLRGLEHKVRLLDLIPLFPSEADRVREIGVTEAGRRFHAEGINPNDPTRDEATLIASDEEPYDPDLEVAPIDETWARLERWLAEHAPKVYAGLLPGASEERLQRFEAAVQQAIGKPLPPDYRACFARHDGRTYLHSYQYMSVDAAEGIWRDNNQMVDDGTFAGRTPDDDSGDIFQPVWWHRGWLPFADDSAGNLICVDLAPGPKGVVGQMILWEVRSGPGRTRAPSVAAWLTAYLAGLESGAYVVTEDGLIERAD
jgi:cell wall assembly regulator SMI1